MMYDELIEALRNSTNPNKYCEDCGFFDKCCLSKEHFSIEEQAADAIEDLSKTLDEEVEINTALGCNMPFWIPVTERLPENQCNVLCDDEGGVVVGYYTDEEVGWHDMHSYKIYPTHWMPLPEPPKEET